MHRRTSIDAQIGATVKAKSSTPTGGGTGCQPSTLSWRERFITPKRYRDGGNMGTEGMDITPTCPSGSNGGKALELA